MSKTSKNYFPTPNEIFSLGLVPGEFAVYAYLLRCENRNAYQCWPSYETIGAAMGMSINMVCKYVCALADKGLISTEDTNVFTRTGLKHNDTRTQHDNLCTAIWSCWSRESNNRCSPQTQPCQKSVTRVRHPVSSAPLETAGEPGAKKRVE